MDVGVVPEGADLVALLTPVVYRIGSTVGAAAMNQDRLHIFTTRRLVAVLCCKTAPGAGRQAEWQAGRGVFAPENRVA